ncbi:MAG: DNA photolyase, partial [Deltaproteobacteria bacterium]|nr:DNA photolyase [Deltaproteobacteria bacterium]
MIEKEVADSPLVKKILATSPGIPVEWVDRVQEDVAGENGSFLEIVKFSGRFIK